MSAGEAKGTNMKKSMGLLAAWGAGVCAAWGSMFGPVVEGPEDAVFGVGESGKLVAEARNCGDFEIELTNGVSLEMVGIEPGRFTMGSPESPVAELGREDGERPHGVALSHGFWMGRYEVTQEQYEALAGRNPSEHAGEGLPVACVTWADAKAFCARLTDREKRAGRLPEGYVYSLPTEAQWEYACRAGMGSALNSGADLTNAFHDSAADAVAWYGGNAQWPQEVGTKDGNAWGLFDMHGNVAEWCADGPWEYPQDGGEETDPAGAARNGENMVRGGSWKSDAAGVRSASREKHGWRTKEDDIGFRVALVPALDRDFPYAEEEGEWKRMEFAWCPPGSFTMGSPADEEGREPVSEGAEGRKGGKEPQREVTLTHGFWMGKYEVTRKQYAGVIGGEAGDEPDLPAVSVSWADATNYAYRLTAVVAEAGALPEGWEFALPTEAQWEYACRALTTNALNNGEELEGGDASEVLEEVGWFLGNSQAGGDERHLHAVGELRPNAWGIYDMHGNAWEWCDDWYDASPSSSSATNPAGPASPVGGDERRTIRGGGFRDVAAFCRAAARCGLDPNQSGGLGDVGFRLVLRKTRDTAANPEWVPWEGLECQWYKDGEAIEGATGTVYAIESVSDADAGDYRLEVANGFGSATGRVATVSVDHRPHEDVDGVRWYYEAGPDGGATVTGVFPSEGEMEMPATLGGLTVTAVGDGAFTNCVDLAGMALADGVTNVGDRAFAGCTGLAWVECPEGLRSIGEKAFQGTGLMAASLPGLECAGEKAFAGCAVLTECTTGAALEGIPAGLFSGCSNLLSFAVADAAGSIGVDAFHSCGSLTNLHIGSNVSEVAAMAITNCGALQVVEAPIALQPTGWTTRQQLGNATVRYYGMQKVTFDAAGGTCEPLTSEFDVQGTYGRLPVPTKDGSVFAGWFREGTGARVREGDKVEPEAAVTLTAHWREGSGQVVDGITWAFTANADGIGATVTGAEPLEGAVAMPAELGGLRVTGIASNAFAGSRDLTAMEIPAGVLEVGEQAFNNCRKLATLTVPSFLGDADWGDGGTAEIATYPAQLVAFEANVGTCAVAKAGYKAAEPYGWLPVATLEGGKFAGWVDTASGERVSADSTVTAAAARTLQAKWASSETVDGVTWFYTLETDGAVVWGAEPAQGWMRMPDTLGGSDVSGVGALAFAGSTWLEGMAMPQTVRFVGEGAFERCPALESIRLPDAAEPVGAGAFEGCGALETVWIGPETRTVCTNAFAGCTNLQVVWLHSDWYGRTGELMGLAAVREEAEYRFYDGFQDAAAEVTWWYWSHEPGRATIMGATPSEGEMALPATVGGDLAVTAVGPEAFWECDGLTGMAIGPGVTNIGSFAFGRSGLEAVELPDGVTELGTGAFYQCGALAEAKLGDGLSAVSVQAFHECSNLVSVAFGGNVREIGGGAFYQCASLEKIELPDGVASIGLSAFEGCVSLREAGLPDGLEDIRGWAFSRCAALESISLPESLRVLEEHAFAWCDSLTNAAVPGGVETVGACAFLSCTNLVSATLAEGVGSIGKDAFYGCAGVRQVVLPSSLRELGEGAFAYCTALQGVSIPATVEEIAEWAFYGCSKMTWAVIPPGVENIGREAFANSGILNGKTPDSVTNIADGAWAGCPAMQEAWIGKNVEKVGQGALAGCTALNTVFVHARWKDTDFLDAAWDWTDAVPKPEGVTILYYDDTEIDGIAWRWGELPGGESVVVYGAEPAAGNLSMPAELGGLPVTMIATDAFKDCLELTGMVISTNVTSIGYQAFGACSNLVSVTLPEGLKVIDKAAFWRSGLTEVAVPAGVTVCGDHAFSECPALAKATFGGGLTAFGKGVFMLSPALAEVAIPDSVTDIPEEAFLGCASLTNVAIPQNVTNIAYGAFALTGLTFAQIPDAVRTVDDGVFWGCPDLLLVYLGRGVESVGTEAFADCPALKEVWLDVRWKDTAFLDGTWGEGGASKPDTVTLRYYGDLDYYVSADGDDANDGLSPATAKREISAAMAVAAPRNTVHVGPGTYGPAMVPQRVTLVSDAGAEKTVIRGAEGTRCLAVGAEAVVKGFTLRDGDATANGGGAWMAAGSRMERCIIRDCKTTKLGGAVAPADNAARRKVMVQNCLIVGNEAGAEGGAAAEGVILAHCTVVGNTGPGARDCAIGGSIVWGNTGAAQAVSSVVEYSLCEGAEGEGNIEGDPLFVGGGDWRLQGASPCIDAATVLAPPVTDDLDGAPRPMPKSFGTGAAAQPDMGCYEFTPKGLFVASGATGMPPYDSWNNAAPDLQSAADAAQDGDVIVVGPGTYGPVSVGPACTVVSLLGPEETVIDAGGASRAVDLLGGGTLEGFTIVNGSAEDCAGILAENGSIVRDVTVSGCNAAGKGGGVCLYGGSTAESVTVAGNTAAFGGGFLADEESTVVRCTIVSNTATQSGGGAWIDNRSILRDSTVLGNTAEEVGGGVRLGLFSEFRNNLVKHNRATTGGGVYAVGADGRDSVIAANTAKDSASALWLQGDLDGGCDAPAFWNLTIVDNDGDAAPVELHDNAVLGNTIVCYNADNGIILHDGAEATTCWTNEQVDPGFVESAEPVEPGERDIHLKDGAPCIGAGTVFLPLMADGYDIDGQGRLVQTKHDGLLVDIGADSATLDCIAVPSPEAPYYVWRVVPGSYIQLESTPSLYGSWNYAAPPATVTNNTWTFTPPSSTPSQLFYRLLWIR